MEPANLDDNSKRRQIELNEWNYHEKMETLFIFQLFFIAFAVSVILLTLSKYGFFSRLYALYVGAILIAILIVVGVIRRLYTKNIRNKTHWNERVFSDDYKLGSLVPPAVLAATSTANAEICNKANGVSTGVPKSVTISCP